MLNSNYYEVEINYALTPQMFYGVFLEELQKYFVTISSSAEEAWILYLNLAHCPNIEGTVVPNLLLVGYIVGRKTESKPILYIPQRGGSKLWNYLNDIGFVELNDDNRIFEIIVGGRQTGESYNFADYCTTTFLEGGLSEEQVTKCLQRRYSKLFVNHLQNFEYAVVSKKLEIPYTVNILEIFCKQLCYNAVHHGESFCYTTMQVNYQKQRIFISIADCGQGMFRTFRSKVLDGYKPVIFFPDMGRHPRNLELEFRAIIEGFVYRFDEDIYGIWSVLRDVMNIGGIIRFHTGKIRVIVADLDVEYLQGCQNKKEVAMYLYNHLNNEDYKQKTPFYQGTHIEMELPLT